MLQKWMVLLLVIALFPQIAPLGFAQEEIDLPQTFNTQGLTLNYPEDWYVEELTDMAGIIKFSNNSSLLTSQNIPESGEFVIAIFPPTALNLFWQNASDTTLEEAAENILPSLEEGDIFKLSRLL